MMLESYAALLLLGALAGYLVGYAVRARLDRGDRTLLVLLLPAADAARAWAIERELELRNLARGRTEVVTLPIRRCVACDDLGCEFCPAVTT